jgi:hypothetical protein
MVIPDHYIIVFNDDVADVQGVTAELARTSGASVGCIYKNALRGFSAHIPAEGLAGVANDPRVKYVEPDQVAHTANSPDRDIIESPPDETHVRTPPNQGFPES